MCYGFIRDLWPRQPKRLAPALKQGQRVRRAHDICSYEFLSPGVVILRTSDPLESNQEKEHFSLKIKYKVRVTMVWKHMEGFRYKYCRIWKFGKKNDECMQS